MWVLISTRLSFSLALKCADALRDISIVYENVPHFLVFPCVCS